MMPRPFPFKLAAVVALAASVGVHAAVAALDPSPDNEVQIAGGATAQTAALGSGFEDLVQAGDRLSPVESEVTQPVDAQLDEIAPTMPDVIDLPPPPASSQPVETEALAPQAVSNAAPAQTPPTPSAPAPSASAVPPVAETPKVVEPQTVVTTTPTPSIASTLVPQQTNQSSSIAAIAPAEPVSRQDAVTPPPMMVERPEIAALQPVSPVDVIDAAPDEPVLPIPAARPFRQIDVDRARAEERRRAERTAERQRQAEQQRAERQRAEQRRQTQQQNTQRQQARGAAQSQANRNARAGRSDGQAQGRSSNAQQGNQRARNAGNAAASNYPGKVYAKIRRTRQRSAGGRGTVRVRFSVSGSGRLAGVSVAASSGNAAVDRAAVDHIRRAAPFPAPPAGAQRRFVIPIEIRR